MPDVELMLSDPDLMKAVSSLLIRSERRQDLRKIIDTFVDVGMLAQITNSNDQIIYGRRGTGKTHVLQVLANRFREDHTNAVVYIDGRTLGSTSQFCDTTMPISQRCTTLFRDVLTEVHNGLLEHIVNNPSPTSEAAFRDLVEFSSVATQPVHTATPSIVKDKDKGTNLRGGSLSSTIGTNVGINLHGKIEGHQTAESEQIVTYRVSSEDKVIFPALHSLLTSVLDKAPATLIILFDEWSSLPQDIQPYLAEFLKRGFLPNPRVVLKLASLEYRSRFGVREGTRTIGFEIGSDISTALDLDDYYVFDRNPDRITGIFADILFRHINSELPEHYLLKYRIDSGDNLTSRLFTGKSAFQELVRASEGVARDFINIFTTAYFDSQRRDRKNIERKSILEAARQWFEKDKEQNLDQSLRTVLSQIVDKVIGSRRARSFLIPRELEKHPVIQQLFDCRVLHLVQRGYADKDNPGRRYNIYTLDYGTYVDLINTSKQPELDMPELKNNDAERVVPFDDKRSIRRIVLAEEDLNL